MPQSLALILVHIVFSTKNRMPFLRSVELRSDMHAYLTASSRGLDCEALQVGGVEDHVHLLSALSRTMSVATLVKSLKTSSTRMAKEKGQNHFAWQSGYGAFSVSESARESVALYILDQENHHRKFSFQDELRLLLNKHRMTFNERYVWD